MNNIADGLQNAYNEGYEQGKKDAVKHGEWIEQDWDDGVYKCSACGEEWCFMEGTPENNYTNYCPNCGARMDGET